MERKNGYYSNKSGHQKKRESVQSTMRILHLNPDQPLSRRPSMQIGIQKEEEFVIRRSMLRTPADGKK